MRHTSALALFLLALATLLPLGGCSGSRTRLNPGADLGWYVADSAWLFNHIPPGVQRTPGSRLDGYYDPANGDIVISEQLHGMRLVNAAFEELSHANDHQRPASLWELIRRYQTPRNPSFLRIAHGPEELARLIAICATLPPADPASPPSRQPH
jgi:hypothetical protein